MGVESRPLSLITLLCLRTLKWQKGHITLMRLDDAGLLGVINEDASLPSGGCALITS